MGAQELVTDNTSNPMAAHMDPTVTSNVNPAAAFFAGEEHVPASSGEEEHSCKGTPWSTHKAVAVEDEYDRDRACNDMLNTGVMAALIGGFAMNNISGKAGAKVKNESSDMLVYFLNVLSVHMCTCSALMGAFLYRKARLQIRFRFSFGCWFKVRVSGCQGARVPGCQGEDERQGERQGEDEGERERQGLDEGLDEGERQDKRQAEGGVRVRGEGEGAFLNRNERPW